MLDFSNTTIEKIIVHNIGNKHHQDGVIISEKELNLSQDIGSLFIKYFLSPFKPNEFYNFTHDESIEKNDVYNIISNIFENPELFISNSAKLAELLYEKSIHPKIKQGELYLVLFENCIVEEEECNAIGIFKSETKEKYLNVQVKNNNISILPQEGINISKLDKGCLVFNTEKNLGYKICLVDNVNKAIEAQYWRFDFLNIKQREDDFYQTQNYLEICKGFVEEVYNEDNKIEKADQIEMLNKSSKFFKEKDEFKMDEFEQEVLKEPNVAKAFKEYKKQYEDDNDITLENNFQIAENAVKKGQSKFKSVLKLDKNFHVYIHGARERLTRGQDPQTGLNFYQLFYENEE